MARTASSTVSLVRGPPSAVYPVAVAWAAGEVARVLERAKRWEPGQEGERPPSFGVRVLVGDHRTVSSVADGLTGALGWLSGFMPDLVFGDKTGLALPGRFLARYWSRVCDVDVASSLPPYLSRSASVLVLGAAECFHYQTGRVEEWRRWQTVSRHAGNGGRLFLAVGEESPDRGFSPYVRRGLSRSNVDYREFWA